MNASSLVMFAFFLAVACVAGAMITYHRYRLNKLRALPKEPTFNNSASAQPIGEDFKGEFSDPVIDATNCLPNKITPVFKVQYAPKAELYVSAKTSVAPPPSQPSTVVLDGPRANHATEVQLNANNLAKKRIESSLFPQDLIILNLMAKPEQPYVGYELLQALLSSGLRFGKMQIFHRYQQLNGGSEVIFSLASIAEPGTFELPKMGAFVSPGLILFLRVSQQKDLRQAFELMYETASQLSDDLGGDICDERRQPLTEEKLNELHEKIEAYENTEHTEDLFVN